jgi:hypothetical protein
MLLAPFLAAFALAGPAVGTVTDHSAVVTWQTAQPTPTALEYGPAAGYGLFAGSGRRETSHAVTLDDLAPGTTYGVRPLGEHEVELTTAAPAPVPHTLTIGRRRALLLDGRPFIPVMQWLQCPSLFDRERSLGIDVFMGRGCSNSDADEVAKTLGRAAFSILPFDAGIGASPSLLAWRADDEPDQNKVPVSSVAAATARGHNASPRRLTFVTLTDGFFGPTHSNVPTAAYARAADVVGFDVYPVYGYCRPDLIAWQADATRALLGLVRPGEPVYSWIEAASTSSQWCHGRGVQPQEVRAETWMTLVNGATAIGYFTHSWTPSYSQFRVAGLVQAELRRTNAQITALTPAILGTPGHVAVDVQSGRVDAMARRYGGAQYVFAVNVSRQPVRASFDVGASGTWRVLDEHRTVTASGGSFRDTFAPLGVHIYIRPPAGFR